MTRALVCVLACAVARDAYAAPFAFSDAQLDALLAESQRTHRPVQSIAELIPLLPDELRQSFTFVYDSRSLFRASISPDFPRVILFSPDATFIAAFTGDPARAGHDVLETLRFDAARAVFVPRVRALPAAGCVDVTALEGRCASCHGEDTRPIFDSYPLWPGFYGSAQDQFPSVLASARVERERYRHFLATEAPRGVYGELRWVKGSRVSPYDDRDASITDGAPADTLVYAPNARLGMALAELNRKRIFRKLAAAPRFADEEPALLAFLLDCDGDRKLAAEPGLRAAVQRENAVRLVRLGVDPERPRDHRFEMQELLQIHNLAQVDEVARRLGVDRDDWSMALEPGSAAFFDGILSGQGKQKSYYLKEDLILELLADLARKQPAFAPYLSVRASFPSLGYPFGHKLELDKASASCTLLRANH